MDPGVRGTLSRDREGRQAERQSGVRKVAVIGALLLAVGVAGQFAWSWSGPSIQIGPGEHARSRGAVTIEAEDLHRAYRDDPRAAAERFEGREMVVSGEFLRIVPEGYGSLDMRLRTSDPDEHLGVDVAQLAIEDAKQLRPGQRVTVSCQGMGPGGDELWVRDCAIQFGGDVAPPPAEGSLAADERE